jgi:excisionase family DNA binding protein
MTRAVRPRRKALSRPGRQRRRKDRCEEMTGPAQSVPSSDFRSSGGSAAAEERLSEVRFLTVAEVATLMRVSKMTVYRLVHGGDLTAVRVGRSFRVPEHAVHEYLRGAFSQTA